MARPATGQVVERRGTRGTTYALRFRAYGNREYVTLGSSADGWTHDRAEEELQNVLADIRRAIWKPPAPAPAVEQPTQEPTFHEFASEWLHARELEGLQPKTIVDLRWSLCNHLLPHFAGLRLSEITAQEVDRFKISKARERQEIDQAHAREERLDERGLSNSSINHVLSDLGQVLATAEEYGLIAANPAAGRRRRLKAAKPARPWVEPEQLPALLDATSGAGRVLLTLLAGCGLRIGEAVALRWRHVDLGTATLHVTVGKTAAAVRSVDLTPAVCSELLVWAATTKHAGPDDYVLATSRGGRQNPSNLRRDVLRPAVEAANAKLAEDGIAGLAPITFHSLRRTFASLGCARGDDVRYTAGQLGHEDPRFTLRCYAQATKRRERLNALHRTAYDRALEWARMGTKEPEDEEPVAETANKTPPERGFRESG